MKKWLIVILGLLGAPGGAFANANNVSLEENVLLMATHVESILNQTDGLMRRSADLLRNAGGMNDVVIQGSLSSYTEQVEAVRALLFINAKGRIAPSFTIGAAIMYARPITKILP